MRKEKLELKNPFDEPLEQIIRKLYADVQIFPVTNFDDTSYGWLVMVDPYISIKFQIFYDKPDRVAITLMTKGFKEKRIFSGPVHGNIAGDDVDFDFIEQILKNFESFK